MRVRITFELSDDDRRALGRLYGERRATRKRIVSWIEGSVRADLDTIISDQVGEALRRQLDSERRADERDARRAAKASPRRYG